MMPNGTSLTFIDKSKISEYLDPTKRQKILNVFLDSESEIFISNDKCLANNFMVWHIQTTYEYYNNLSDD